MQTARVRFKRDSGSRAPAAAALTLALTVATTCAATAQAPFWSNTQTEYSIGIMRGTATASDFTAAGALRNRQDFKIDNVAMFNTHTSVQLMSRLRAGVRSSFNLTDGASSEEHDYALGCPLKPSGLNECVRHLPARLDRASLFELYGAGTVYEAGGIKLDLLAGYKVDQFKWRTHGGTGEGIGGGAYLPSVTTSYEQSFSAPYLGVALAVQQGAWSARGRVIGSAWAKAEDTFDRHPQATTTSHGTMDARFVAAEIGLAWRLNPFLSLTGDYRYQRWESERGATALLDRTTGTVFTPGRAGTADNATQMITLGAKVDLQALARDGLQDEAARPAVWTGWAFGVTGGMQAGANRWRTTNVALLGGVEASTAAADFEGSGQRAGLFLGHSWRAGSLIWGIEADVGKSNATEWKHGIPGTFPAGTLGLSDTTQVGAGWDASLRLRVGMQVMPSILVYATGGLAAGETAIKATCLDSVITTSACGFAIGIESISVVRTGWTAGLGYEWAHNGGWFTRGEYRYTSLGEIRHKFFDDGSGEDISARIKPANHRLSFGLGYRF